MKRLIRGLGLLIALLCFAAALTACGSSSGSSSDSETTAQSSSEEETTAQSSSEKNGDGGADVIQAEAFLKGFLQPATEITIDEPLKEKPPTSGQKVIFLQPKTTGTNQVGEALDEATKALGWEYGTVSFDESQPQTLQAAFHTALSQHPTLVYVLAQEEANWGSNTVAEYEKAGVRILASAIPPVPKDGWVLGTPNSPTQNRIWGKALAAWFVADSNGEGDVAVSSLPFFPGLRAVTQGFEEGVKEFCPSDCSVHVVKVTLDQVASGKVPSTMVSYLRTSPDTDYLMFDYGPFSVGINSQLAAAGLDGIKIFGDLGAAENITSLQSKTQSAWTVFNNKYQAWEGLDIYLRHLEGSPEAEGDQLEPVQLLTQENVNDVEFNSNTEWEYPQGYQEQFEALWHLK